MVNDVAALGVPCDVMGGMVFRDVVSMLIWKEGVRRQAKRKEASIPPRLASSAEVAPMRDDTLALDKTK